MREVDRLRRQLESTLDGDPWYGTAVSQILEGVEAVEAAAHPVKVRIQSAAELDALVVPHRTQSAVRIQSGSSSRTLRRGRTKQVVACVEARTVLRLKATGRRSRPRAPSRGSRLDRRWTVLTRASQLR